MKLTFKSRIALHYVLATAALVLVAYLVVFGVVQQQVLRDLDADLRFEATKHLSELTDEGGRLRFAYKAEWQEREHREVQVNPVFIQLTDTLGRLLDRSPNLNRDQLSASGTAGRLPANSTLRGRAIRQVQVPVVRGGRRVGYLLAAIPSQAARHVLASLEAALLLSYPLVLLVLFVSARLLAGRSIAPLTQITATTNRITRSSLGERIELPARPDELHTLASAINALLQRIEAAVERERQFTADASHELRTPLSVLKGTLEVLARKVRTPAEYTAGIERGILEIDRLTHLVEQLLVLARFENHATGIRLRELTLLACVDDVLHRRRQELAAKHIRVDVRETATVGVVVSDGFLVDLMLDNLLANAIKYSPANSTITVALELAGPRLLCHIRDQGIGIAPAEVAHIFKPLYRADALTHHHIGGSGLGLSIVDKAATLLGVEVAVQSAVGHGSTFTLSFPS